MFHQMSHGRRHVSKTSKAINQKNILVPVILTLVVIVAVFAFLNRSTDNLREGELLIKAGDTGIARLTIDDIRKLPAVEKDMVINSSRGTTKHEFTGAALLDVLNSVNPGLAQKYARVITKGVDNYTSAVEMAEVLERDHVFIVYADGGKPLKTKTGKDGAMRIIIAGDQFGQRFTNFLVSLELQ